MLTLPLSFKADDNDRKLADNNRLNIKYQPQDLNQRDKKNAFSIRILQSFIGIQPASISFICLIVFCSKKK